MSSTNRRHKRRPKSSKHNNNITSNKQMKKTDVQMKSNKNLHNTTETLTDNNNKTDIAMKSRKNLQEMKEINKDIERIDKEKSPSLSISDHEMNMDNINKSQTDITNNEFNETKDIEYTFTDSPATNTNNNNISSNTQRKIITIEDNNNNNISNSKKDMNIDEQNDIENKEMSLNNNKKEIKQVNMLNISCSCNLNVEFNNSNIIKQSDKELIKEVSNYLEARNINVKKVNDIKIHTEVQSEETIRNTFNDCVKHNNIKINNNKRMQAMKTSIGNQINKSRKKSRYTNSFYSNLRQNLGNCRLY
eukprot:136100_1